jgi:hypothetical protein
MPRPTRPKRQDSLDLVEKMGVRAGLKSHELGWNNSHPIFRDEQVRKAMPAGYSGRLGKGRFLHAGYFGLMGNGT